MGNPPDDGKLCRCAYEMLGNLGAPPFRSFSFPPLQTPPGSRSHAMAGSSLVKLVAYITANLLWPLMSNLLRSNLMYITFLLGRCINVDNAYVCVVEYVLVN
jgi:hypothetical protein